ncbi:glutamate dehydrogenase/leucine dehydrogenase [Bradyrhizobium sp. LB7.1]
MVRRAAGELNIHFSGATAVAQRFRNVGSIAALELHGMGVKVIAVSDHTGGLYRPGGLNIPQLVRHAGLHSSLEGCSDELGPDPAEILSIPCDVLVPAAVERVIDAHIAANLRCRILAEGANGPTTPKADRILERRQEEIFVIPDILCNSGGVVVSYFEWVRDLQRLFWEEEDVMRRVSSSRSRFRTRLGTRQRRKPLQSHRSHGHRCRARSRSKGNSRATSIGYSVSTPTSPRSSRSRATARSRAKPPVFCAFPGTQA